MTSVRDFIDYSAIDRQRDVSAYTPDEQASYASWGYRYVGASFRPHFTLGRLDEQSAQEVCDRAKADGVGVREWRFNRLSVYVAGKNGAHERSVAEVLLDSL
jgi:2'-5' RNA ligase